ncbi:MAG: hypothetical protein KAY24_12905 [Candidatus Eisenbacteria sp.]|nr:hypothetical protein [Candidatus Eisenbacteria bacterium]
MVEGTGRTGESRETIAAEETLAWRADSTFGADEVVTLIERGLLHAAIAPASDGSWILRSGEPVRGLRIVWASNDSRAAPGHDMATGTDADVQTDARTCHAADGTTAPKDLQQSGSETYAGHGIQPDPIEIPWSQLDSPAREIQRRVAATLDRCAEEGHPLARVSFEDFVVDSLLTVRLGFEAGPHVSVQSVRFEGARATRASFLRRCLGWKGPRAYRSSEWRKARGVLAGTGLFDRIEGPLLIWPAEARSVAADSVSLDLLLRLHERPVNQLSALLGYAGQEDGRLFGFVDLELGNLMGTGRATRVLWEAWEASQSRFEFSWHEPFIWRFPLALDLSLRHVLEDTLFAETTWGFDLLWAPLPAWKIGVGWGWSRLVFGREDARQRRRTTSAFALERAIPGSERSRRGWRMRTRFAHTSDGGSTLRRGSLEAAEWTTWGRIGLWLEQEAGIVAGADSLLRSDAFLLGGTGSLRGSFEGTYRTFQYMLQRAEIGPRPVSERAARFYLLLDMAWYQEATVSREGLHCRKGGDRYLWATGAGVCVPSRAGDLRLDYAIPGGKSVSRGRIHFELVSRF